MGSRIRQSLEDGPNHLFVVHGPSGFEISRAEGLIGRFPVALYRRDTGISQHVREVAASQEEHQRGNIPVDVFFANHRLGHGGTEYHSAATARYEPTRDLAISVKCFGA